MAKRRSGAIAIATDLIQLIKRPAETKRTPWRRSSKAVAVRWSSNSKIVYENASAISLDGYVSLTFGLFPVRRRSIENRFSIITSRTARDGNCLDELVAVLQKIVGRCCYINAPNELIPRHSARWSLSLTTTRTWPTIDQCSSQWGHISHLDHRHRYFTPNADKVPATQTTHGPARSALRSLGCPLAPRYADTHHVCSSVRARACALFLSPLQRMMLMGAVRKA
jgi:hypothetical protein